MDEILSQFNNDMIDGVFMKVVTEMKNRGIARESLGIYSLGVAVGVRMMRPAMSDEEHNTLTDRLEAMTDKIYEVKDGA